MGFALPGVRQDAHDAGDEAAICFANIWGMTMLVKVQTPMFIMMNDQSLLPLHELGHGWV